MIIDMHTHPFGNPNFSYGNAIKTRRDVVTLRRRKPEIFRSRYVNAREMTDLLIEDMHVAGIDRTIIQPGFCEDPELVAAAVSKYPDKLSGLFNIGHEETKHPSDSDIYQSIDWNRTAEQIDHYIKDFDLRGCGEVMLTRFTRESAPEMIATTYGH